MAEQRMRELEREGGAPWLAERLRRGDVERSMVELAAYCSHGPWHRIRAGRLMVYEGVEPCGAGIWEACRGIWEACREVPAERVREAIAADLARWALR